MLKEYNTIKEGSLNRAIIAESLASNIQNILQITKYLYYIIMRDL